MLVALGNCSPPTIPEEFIYKRKKMPGSTVPILFKV